MVQLSITLPHVKNQKKILCHIIPQKRRIYFYQSIFYSPTDAQVNCLKDNLKFTLQFTLKQFRHVSVQSHHHQSLIYTASGILRGGGGFGVFNPPPKFRSFDKAEPNSQFRGKCICNNLTRIQLSLIFWVVSWKALPASYDPPQWYFFFSKAWHDISIKYQKLRKFYHMK